MDFEEFQARWRDHQARAESERDPAVIADQIRAHGAALDRQARRRDLTENAAALAMVPVFGWLAVNVPSPLSRAGAALIALGCVLIPWRLRLARGAPIDQGLAVLPALRAERERLTRQHHLLQSIAWWYLGPLLGGCVLFIGGGIHSRGLRAGVALVVIAVAAALYRANRVMAERQLAPVIAALDELITDFAQTPTAGDGDAR